VLQRTSCNGRSSTRGLVRSKLGERAPGRNRDYTAAANWPVLGKVVLPQALSNAASRRGDSGMCRGDCRPHTARSEECSGERISRVVSSEAAPAEGREGRRDPQALCQIHCTQWPKPCWTASSLDMNAGFTRAVKGAPGAHRGRGRRNLFVDEVGENVVAHCRPSCCVRWDRGKSPGWAARPSRGRRALHCGPIVTGPAT